MTSSHHPSTAVLVDYAAGTLAIGQVFVVAAHLGACPSCRADVERIEAVGGVFLNDLPPEKLAPDALSRALAQIERPAPASTVMQARADWITVPRDVLEAARRRRRWAAPGVWVAPVTKGPGDLRTYLLRVAPGMSVPRHTHRGSEMVCVLKGAFVDGAHTYARGDFAYSDGDVEHCPVVTRDGECVCLVAAQGALIPRDWVGRVFQPFVGI